jgi:osomolarity two-component system phosphorelay intermediate protein YPD1
MLIEEYCPTNRRRGFGDVTSRQNPRNFQSPASSRIKLPRNKMATKVSEKSAKQVLDIQVFEQILEMDEDPVQREFSSEIVVSFFEETQKVLTSMEEEV